MLLVLLLIALTTQATMVEARLRHHRNAQFVDPVIAIVALEQSSSSLPTSTSAVATPSLSDNVLDAATTASTITSAASLSSASSSSCVPMSICVDGFTCSIRYGGCYDKNYCDGNTSPYPIPTCDPSPANGLTSNNVGAARQREDPDIAGEVIVKKLMDDKDGAD